MFTTIMTLIRTKHSVIQHRFLTLRGRSTEIPLSLYLHKNGTYHLNGIGENARNKGRCIHTSSWQASHRPSCNAFHELDLTQTTIKFLASGSYRHVWSFQEYNGDVSALKTLHYKREFDKRNFERHRRDAVTMERLSSSSYIVDIHGHCFNSALIDYTQDGDLTWLHCRETRLSKLDMLEIAHDVTAALADLHHAGIVHADIKPNQFLNFEGKYKLNDFNRAHFAKQNADTNKTCGFSETHNVGAVSTVRAALESMPHVHTHYISLFCFHQTSH
jgi:serine/threonine protein kinase